MGLNTGFWRRTIGAVLAAAAVSACASGAQLPPPAPLTENEGPVASSVFAVAYNRISNVYLLETDLGDLAVNGLSGLSTIDPDLQAERVDGGIRMVAGDQFVGLYPDADAEDGRGWGAVTAAAVADARLISPALESALPEEVYEAVLDAVTANLDDYSRYSNAVQAQQERAYRDGYGGIGLMLEQDEDGRARVQEVFTEGPAARAGVRAGDMIVAVAGQDTADWTLEKLGLRLRGIPGTEVEVTFKQGDSASRILTLRRERVVLNVVDIAVVDGIVAARISRFNAGTLRNLNAGLDRALEDLGADAQGVILDLRGNPGGLLGQAVSVADLFIEGGEIISTRGRHPDSRRSYGADSNDAAHGLPVAVLIDGRSASGAEVVAAAMQDSGRAVLIGATTFGKGSVQTVTPLPNDGELYLTWSRIYAPSGYTLHRQGVLPAICTSGATENADELIAAYRAGGLVPIALLTTARQAAPD
ncbi:MAG: S41 family peptidase, partial [Inquilinus sp.]|nr:S41 family peptidase [Inquilinus sp.]